MERTGLLPGAKSPYLKDYAERWLEEYRLNVKPTTYRTRAGRIHACMEVIGCIRLTELTPDHIRQCMRVLSKRLAPSKGGAPRDQDPLARPAEAADRGRAQPGSETTRTGPDRGR